MHDSTRRLIHDALERKKEYLKQAEARFKELSTELSQTDEYLKELNDEISFLLEDLTPPEH